MLGNGLQIMGMITIHQLLAKGLLIMLAVGLDVYFHYGVIVRGRKKRGGIERYKLTDILR